jgi:hypothetical protein
MFMASGTDPVVENVTHNPKIEDFNPAGTGREKWQQSGSSTVVENVTHNPKIEG